MSTHTRRLSFIHVRSSVMHSSRAFTLIEMVVVMALIGLLLTLAVPRYFTALDNGRVRVQQQNLASMRDAIDKFFSDQGRYPIELDELVQNRYLRSIPIDPVAENTNWVIVAPTDPELAGVYDVRSATRIINETPTHK